MVWYMLYADDVKFLTSQEILEDLQKSLSVTEIYRFPPKFDIPMFRMSFCCLLSGYCKFAVRIYVTDPDDASDVKNLSTPKDFAVDESARYGGNFRMSCLSQPSFLIWNGSHSETNMTYPCFIFGQEVLFIQTIQKLNRIEARFFGGERRPVGHSYVAAASLLHPLTPHFFNLVNVWTI